MKKILTFVILFGSAGMAIAQNFGIDQPSPAEKLDVNGNIKVGTLYGPYVMYGTVGSFDTRSTNPPPETYRMGVTSEFKANSANGLNDGGSFNSVMSIRQWSSSTDWSGGGVHQLSFTQNGNMFHRYSQSTGSWGAWRPVNKTIIWSGGCTNHGTAGGWNTYCNDGQSTFSNAQSLGYITANGAGTFTFNVAGYYHVSLWWITLGNNQGTTDTDWYRNGSRVLYKHAKNAGNPGAWDSSDAEGTYYFNAGDTFYMNIHNPGNYAYHAWNVCECWHSRVQITYEGN